MKVERTTGIQNHVIARGFPETVDDSDEKRMMKISKQLNVTSKNGFETKTLGKQSSSRSQVL